MGKAACLVLLLCLIECAEWTQANADKYSFKLALRRKERVARLHFYFHDTFSGSEPTTMRIAQANTTNKSATLFGALWMADNPLTTGPEPTSELVGWAQGLHASAAQQEPVLLLVQNFVFTSGTFNGSSVSVLGRSPVLENVRETPIVGGTGAFRLSRGVATSKTYFANATTQDAIIEFDLEVVY